MTKEQRKKHWQKIREHFIMLRKSGIRFNDSLDKTAKRFKVNRRTVITHTRGVNKQMLNQ
jgi:hypothetical protein